jgi:hygromycin-B 7''-O-kinase
MPEALTVERASVLFAELLPAYGPVRAVSRFAQGSVNGAYRIDFTDAATVPVVLKAYPLENPWWGFKEARALSFLTEHGIDISPRLLAFSKSAEALGGRACVVCELRPGRMLEELDDELTPAQWHDVYRQLGQVLRRLHDIPADGYGYVVNGISDPLPDNSAHMARLTEREVSAFREHGADPALADQIAAYFADHASAFAQCTRPSYCHGDVHEPNLLAEPAGDGTWRLTGLLDAENMHAADPLMDFVRLDAFSLQGDRTKIAGLLAGYGVSDGVGVGVEAPEGEGEWPEAWRSRLPLYRVLLALELYNWFSITGATEHLSALELELRGFVGELSR